jgi:cell wall-associated NlpC family hydrolase
MRNGRVPPRLGRVDPSTSTPAGSGPARRAGGALRRAAAVVTLAALAGCAPLRTQPPGPPPPEARGAAVLAAAESRLGAPYRYGGSGPEAFDCSGLVSYAYLQVGVAVPRTAAAQHAAATPVAREDLRPGDLVFGRLDGREVSHVGIYAGGGRFVHAPQRGGRVREERLDQEVFRRGWAGGGRFDAPR